MSAYFEELDFRSTPIGALSLRRRRELSLGKDVFEIKLGDEYLMSSLFTESEIALARLALAGLTDTTLDVVVGGLGLGYTAHAVLRHEAVRSMIVVEMLDAVIEWHEDGLLPLGPELTAIHAAASYVTTSSPLPILRTDSIRKLSIDGSTPYLST